MEKSTPLTITNSNGTVAVGFVADKVAVGQGLLRLLRSFPLTTYRQYSTLTTRPFDTYRPCVAHIFSCLILYQSSQRLIQSQLFLRHINHVQTHVVNIRHYMCT